MERKRIDLAGAGSKPSANPPRGGGMELSSGDKKKNLILLTVAGVVFLVAGYIVYANYIATPKAPPEAAAPVVDAAFDQAAKQPAPPPDNQPLPERGGGKHVTPGGR